LVDAIRLIAKPEELPSVDTNIRGLCDLFP
jgi:hypothetical protein